MKNIKPSPKILAVSWGHIEVEGIGTGKDFKLYPGGGHEWDWRLTGTQHDPGIQPGDVEELMQKGAKVIVLSQGMNLRLNTTRETIQYLESNGIDFYIKETKEAVELYNQLAATEAVGGLFHSTC